MSRGGTAVAGRQAILYFPALDRGLAREARAAPQPPRRRAAGARPERSTHSRPGDAEKAVERRTLLRRRAGIAPSDRTRISAAVAAFVTALPAYRRARHVLAYRALGAEVDVAGIVEHALSSHKRVYYPRVVGTALEFAEVCTEPAGRERVYVADGDDAVALVPGVGFDVLGVRLGRGGGHYDRALARLPRVFRVGIACEAQLVASLPRDPWDAVMDCIVTERRVLAVVGPRRGLEENGS